MPVRISVAGATERAPALATRRRRGAGGPEGGCPVEHQGLVRGQPTAKVVVVFTDGSSGPRHEPCIALAQVTRKDVLVAPTGTVQTDTERPGGGAHAMGSATSVGRFRTPLSAHGGPTLSRPSGFGRGISCLGVRV